VNLSGRTPKVSRTVNPPPVSPVPEHRFISGTVARCSCGWHLGCTPADLLTGYCDADERLPEHQRLRLAAAAAWRTLHAGVLASTDPAHQLILLQDSGGDRHYLAGRPVPFGALLELQMADGSWWPVRYRWSWRRSDAPVAVVRLGPPEREQVGGTRSLLGEMHLPTQSALRWPRRNPWRAHPSDPPPLEVIQDEHDLAPWDRDYDPEGAPESQSNWFDEADPENPS
jgi:hypothetical protein